MGIIHSGYQMSLHTQNKGTGSEVKTYMVLRNGDFCAGHARTVLNWKLNNFDEHVMINFIIYITIINKIKLKLMVVLSTALH
jgi:hypothetical protein